MEILGKLFGSSDRVKLMRLFVLNPTVVLPGDEVGARAKVTSKGLRKELELLKRVGFAQVKTITLTPAPAPKIVTGRKAKKLKIKKVKGWQLNQSFPFLNPLRNLLRNDVVGRRREIASRFAHTGNIKFLVISGIFIDQPESRADLLLVGDHLKRAKIERAINMVEAEVGRELNYSVMETADFNYRFHACDKFIRDILDYPHERLIDKLGV